MQNFNILGSGYYLIVDTALAYNAACIACEGKVLASFVEENTSGQSGRYMFKLQELFQQSNLTASELIAICVSMGPGSYTGLRIGMSSMKGLAFADKIPLYGFSTLQSIAMKAVYATKHGGNTLALIDARRMNAYAGLFENTGKPLWNNRFVSLQSEEILELVNQSGNLLITSDNPDFCDLIKNFRETEYYNLTSDISYLGNIIYESGT